MPITFKRGNLLESNCEVLVCTTNTVGVMGKGIALQFKNKWPSLYRAYKHDCDARQMSGGEIQSYRIGGQLIICFMTKEHWRDPSKIQWIERGLYTLQTILEAGVFKSIAIPPLGCGNGGLKWSAVKPLITHYLGGIPNVDIQVYEGT